MSKEQKRAAARARVRASEKVTDAVVAAWNEAQNELSICLVNGLGVLDEPSATAGRLRRAKAAIEKAQAAMREHAGQWPTKEVYDTAD